MTAVKFKQPTINSNGSYFQFNKNVESQLNSVLSGVLSDLGDYIAEESKKRTPELDGGIVNNTVSEIDPTTLDGVIRVDEHIGSLDNNTDYPVLIHEYFESMINWTPPQEIRRDGRVYALLRMDRKETATGEVVGAQYMLRAVTENAEEIENFKYTKREI